MNLPTPPSPRVALAAIVLVLLAVAATFRPIVGAVRLGLEFRGGYEMLYVARPKTPQAPPAARESLLSTVRQLESRAREAGVREPDIRIEGADQIRVRLPGVSGDADAKAMMRDSRSLPLDLVEKYSQTVGGQLGDDSLAQTLRAGAVAVGVVALLMISLYRLPGLLAVVGLLLYLWVMAAAFAGLHLTLSLSGVVALVLGVGLAADANIIIYERFREARTRGEERGPAAVEAVILGGRAILEANAAALVAAAVLFFSGIAPIQAFAETMLLSLVASVLTNLVFTGGLLLSFALSPKAPDALFGRTHPSAPLVAPPGRSASGGGPLRILRFRVAFFALALLAVVAGAVSLKTTALNLDIDFKAGTMLDLKAERPLTQEAATAVILGTGIAPDGVTVAGSPPTKVTARFENILNGAQLERIAEAFRPAYGPTITYEENTADPTVAREFVTRSVGCLLLTAAIVAALVAWRFGWRSAVGAGVAMGFSSFFVLGFFSLTHQEIDLTFVAAVLTVLTYAINECVIVFDRLRENRRARVVPDEDAWALADRSLRQIIRRSLLTALMLVVGAASLYFLGAEPLQMFALAVFVGLLAATFASIGLATPIWAWLTGEPPALHPVEGQPARTPRRAMMVSADKPLDG